MFRLQKPAPRSRHLRAALSGSAKINPKEAVERLRRLDCCAISDALDRLKLGGVVSGVPQQSGDTCIAGRAVTVKLGIGTGPKGPPRHLGTGAVDAAGPDNIIVVEQRP